MSKPARLATLDGLRGVAVVLMVAWHASDGWLRREHHEGLGWDAMRIAGGLAAPLFLLAAGAAVGLGARRGRGLERVIVRGVELIVLGHALRLAQWGIDRGAIVTPSTWPALVLGACFVVAALGALRGSRRPRALSLLAALFASAHVLAVLALGPTLARLILRFDVLHCIGASCIVCALVAYGTTRIARDGSSLAWAPSVLLAVGALCVVSLPLAADLDRAGGTLSWIARGPELRRFAPFPLVPWTGYAMLGCAATLAPLTWSGRRAVTFAVFTVAAAVAIASFEGGFLFRWSELGRVSFARPIARLTFAASAAIAMSCVLTAIARHRAGEVLAIVGRASLVIYALHLFVTYGKLGRPVAHALDPLACGALVITLIAICVAGALLASRRGGRRAHTVAAHVDGHVGSSANSSA